MLTNVGKGPTSAAVTPLKHPDDVLRVTYLDLARLWRKMAHEAELLERKAAGPTKIIRRTAKQVFALSGFGPPA